MIRCCSPVRIAFIAESFLPRVNGVSNSVQKVSTYCNSVGIENLIITPAAPETLTLSPFNEVHNIRRTKFIQLPKVPDFEIALSSVNQIKKLLIEFKPDLVHLASPFVLGWLGLRAANSLNIPSVAVYQTDVSGFAKFYGFPIAAKLAEKWTLNIHQKATLNLVPSTSALKFFDSAGIPNSKIWGRGVDVELFNPNRRSGQLRFRWIQDEKIIIGFVGRLAPEKQIERLAALNSEKYQLVIIGDGPERENLSKLLPSATFLGRLTGIELASAVSSLDILVAPGEHETFCQVVQEAMASGVPVVAPNVGGPIDLVSPGLTGFLYKPGDTQSMLQAIEILAGDADLRKKFGTAGRKKVEGNSWEKLSEQLILHYLDVCRLSIKQAA